MKQIRIFALAVLALLALSTSSFAQSGCGGQFSGNTLCGTATTGLPGQIGVTLPLVINTGTKSITCPTCETSPAGASPVLDPVLVATTGSNITLSGVQTIDGVSAVAGSRVLVKDQSTPSQNGIYVTASSSWTRASDFNTTGQVIQGTQVYVTQGTVNATKSFAVSTANPITIGTTSIAFIYAPNWNTHLVVYTVAPSGASVADQQRADYVGDGVNDQTAVNAAVNAAKAVSSFSKVVMLPGVYNFSATALVGGGNGFIFEARGTKVNGPGVGGSASSADAFGIQNSNWAEFNFGAIKTNNTGTAAAIHSTGNFSETKITWQSLDGTGRSGYGYFADTTSAGTSQSVNWITATHVQNFAKGIVLSAVGSGAVIDTHVIDVSYVYNNVVGIYEHAGSGGNINSIQYLNANIDCSHTNGDIAFETNSLYDFGNFTIGSTTTLDAGICVNMQFDSGATANNFVVTPQSLAQLSGSITDNSGNTTNAINNLPTALLGTNVATNIVQFNGNMTGTTNFGQYDNSGIKFGSGSGAQYDLPYYTAAGTIGHLTPGTGTVLQGGSPSAFTATPTLGRSGTTGTLSLNGSTSGGATITPQSVAGTPTITLGTNSGTPAVTASSPLGITAATGNVTCATCVTSSGGGAISGTAPVAVSAAGVVSITGVAGQILGGSPAGFTATPTLGSAGTTGTISLNGSTSGGATITPQAVAGTPTITLGTSSGTPAVTASSPLAINAATGNITCSTCLTANQTITLSGDVTGSGTTAITTAVANIPSGTTAAGSILATEISAPGTPASGKVSIWTDSTDARFHDKNPAGSIGTTVVADTGAASNYISAISAAGVISKSRPACSTLSDSAIGCSNTTGPTTTVLSGASGTYSIPAGTNYIKIRMIGPGGGGSGSGTGATAGGNGSAAAVFSVHSGAAILTANNGVGGGTNSGGGTGGTASGGNVVNFTGGSGASGPNGIVTNFPGGNGCSSPFASAGMGGNTGGAGTTAAGYGSGGGGAGQITTPNVGAGGGCGGYIEHIINNPSASYDYTIGTAGGAGSAGTGGAAGGAGGAGIIIIEEHYNF